MPRRGRALERLVAAIERATNNQPHIKVESPGWRLDKRINRRREHDVLITVQEAHHTMLLALECRDRGRRVGVPDIEAFQTKCRDTGIDRGIMVSSTGFRRTALVKAAAYNISCLDLEQSEALDWCSAPGIMVHARNIEHVFLRAIPDSPISTDAVLCVDPDTAFSEVHASNIAKQFVNMLSFECDGEATFSIRQIVNTSDIHAREPDGRKVRVSRVLLGLRVLVRPSLAPFDLRTYRDAITERELYTAAVARVDFGGAVGSIVLVRKDGVGTDVSWVPDPATQTAAKKGT